MATLRRDYEILIKELEIMGIGPAVAKGRKTTRLLGTQCSRASILMENMRTSFCSSHPWR